MARNQEKAQTMLARWLRYKEEEVKGPKKRRPYLAELCSDVHEAEKWRGSIIGDISRNVAEIQNSSLGEHRIRDLNDRINKLFREKRHWEKRIAALGGKHYKSGGHRAKDAQFGGYGHGAYLYFGAARDLPGVRELLEQRETERAATRDANGRRQRPKDRVTGTERRSRSEMLKAIDADYYGFGDDDDNALIWREKKMQRKLRKAKIEEWRREHPNELELEKEVHSQSVRQNEDGDGETAAQRKRRLRREGLRGHIPTQTEIDAMILQKRKDLLLQKYAGNTVTEEAKSLAMAQQQQQQIDVPKQAEADIDADADDDVDM